MTANPSALNKQMAAGDATAIIIAAYNAEATLAHAVHSALAEPETAEVCIVDDASTDRTLAIAHELASSDARIKVIPLASNGGPSIARNAALAATRSPWITILDADDYFLPGRLSRLHAIANDADFIGDALIRTPTGVTPAWRPRSLAPNALTLTDFLLGNLGEAKGALDLGFLKPLMRRSFLDTHAIKYSPEMRLGEDYELYARALALGARFVVCGEAGYVSVEREGSLSKDHSEADLQRLRDCDDAIVQLRPLSSAESVALKRHWASVDRRLQWRRLISAVKTRDPASALSTFRSPDAALYLCGKLAEQAWLRSTGRGPRALSTEAAR
jgi:succinoglycan biosynthesis protein ExoU